MPGSNRFYERNTAFLRERCEAYLRGEALPARVRATYPFVRIATTTYARVDSRLAYGFVGPGVHETTVTRPDLYRGYFLEQIRHLLLVWTAPDGIKRARMRSL